MYPAKFPGLGEALIFFCFFSCIKTRKEDYEGKKKNAYSRYRSTVSYRKRPRGVCNTPLQPAGRWVSHSAKRHSVKPDGFWTLPHDIEQNPAGFGLCHTTWCETRRVLDSATRHDVKPGGFWTLPRVGVKPAGFYSNLWQNECETYQVSGCRGVLHTPLGRPRKGTFVPMTLFILK